MRRKRTLRVIALALVALIVAACNDLTVDQSGVYTSSPTQEVTGTIKVGAGDSLVSLKVNGIDATADGEHYFVDLPLDGAKIFNEVLVEARYAKGSLLRQRRTVVYGDGDHATVLPAGEELDDAVGLRVNERSFSKLGPVVKNLTEFDTSTIAPVGTVFLDECITRVIVCTLYVTATTAGLATIQDFDVALDSNQDNVRAVVTLHGMLIPIAIHAAVLGIPTNCTMNVDADTITIDGNYALQPDATDPHFLDVNLVGATPTVTLGAVRHDFVSGICSIPGIEQIVGLFLPDVEKLMQSKLTTLLGDPDGSGPQDSPVADAVEQALAKLNIAGDIGTALGPNVESKITAANEDPAGIGLRATAAFTSAGAVPDAPDLPGSVGFGDTLGALPSTTPGGRAFDVAVGASASSFNQLLAGETERGLLNVDVTQLDGQPLTLKSLFDLIGAGALITQDHPVVVQLRPEVAPIVTTSPGPNGATGELKFYGYKVTVKTSDATNATILGMVLDFRTGMGMQLVNGGLGFTFNQPAPEDFHATVTVNPNNLPEDLIQSVFQQLSPRVFASVQDSLPSFPLPQFAGLDLAPVEIGRVGSGFVLFADLVPAG